jgi:hypothetical protein
MQQKHLTTEHPFSHCEYGGGTALVSLGGGPRRRVCSWSNLLLSAAEVEGCQ